MLSQTCTSLAAPTDALASYAEGFIYICIAAVTITSGLETSVTLAQDPKFLVYKGREGFGDRLQQLLYAIQYAKATGRIMVPEWSDKRWADHDQSNFEDYLRLDGLRTMRWKPEFLTMWRNRRESLSVIPNAWHFLFERPVSAADLDSPRFLLAKNNAILQVCKHAQPHCQTVDNNIWQDIIDGHVEDFKEDVVVYAGVGIRNMQYEYFENLRLSPWMVKHVKRRMHEEGATINEYVAIHLRGGDKPWR